ncbi:MAG: DUF5715 family protein [Acidobacteriaceae bacterium]
MTKHSWVEGGFRERAAVCLRAVVAAGLALATVPALAVGHHPEQHLMVAHSVSRRAVVQAAPESGKTSKRKSRGAKPNSGVTSATRSGKPAPKSRRRRSRPADEADNDPPVLHRASSHIARRRGRLIVPPPMKGSWDILVHQNTMADSDGLDRIQDDDDLDRLRAQHLLVPLTGSAGLAVNRELPENRRYARPWAVSFASDMARAFYARFRQPLRLNSAVRTVEYQLRLQRVNGNAAAVDGDGASPHLTGQALDFGKHGMSMAQIGWMRAYLAPLMQAGKLDVEEEFKQACFHISVYRGYLPAVKVKAKVEVAQLPAGQTHAIAKIDSGLR